MFRRISSALLFGLLLAVIAQPVMAAPMPQGGSGLHFGPYTLSAGDSVSGDLVVFGPATLEDESRFNGDLVAFASASIAEDALLLGDLVVMGDVNIEGMVDGNLFVAGTIDLEETAHVSGDISAVGEIIQADGAVVEGSIIPVDTIEEFEGIEWDIPFVPVPFVSPNMPRMSRTPTWLRVLGNMARAIVGVLIMGLVALVVVSVWPQQTQRVSRVIAQEPLTAFGVGLLAFVVSAIVLTILTITICLSLFALLGAILIGVAVLFGWVALGVVLGERILAGLSESSSPHSLVVSAVFGSALIALILAMARVFWPIRGILIFFLMPPAAGAVLLTRFGTMPYVMQRTGSAVSRPPAPRPAPTPAPIVPAELDAPGSKVGTMEPAVEASDFSEEDDATSSNVPFEEEA